MKPITTASLIILFCGLLLSANLQAAKLKVLTLNVWDVGFASGDYSEVRHKEICKRLKAAAADTDNGWDIVLIQELWPRTRKDIYQNCGYPHTANAESKWQAYARVAGPLLAAANKIITGETDGLDTGLHVLSKFPTLPARRITYSVNGELSGIASDGDILANKSAILVPVLHPTAGPILVFNTHLVSRTDKNLYGNPNNYNSQRRLQLQELASFVDAYADAQLYPVILGGDFNIGPWGEASPENTQYTDSYTWNELIPNLFPTLKRAGENNFYCTYCPKENIFANQNEANQNIDHIFVSKSLTVKSSQIAMNEKIPLNVLKTAVKEKHKALVQETIDENAVTIPGLKYSRPEKAPDTRKQIIKANYSDHFGFEVALELPELSPQTLVNLEKSLPFRLEQADRDERTIPTYSKFTDQ